MAATNTTITNLLLNPLISQARTETLPTIVNKSDFRVDKSFRGAINHRQGLQQHYQANITKSADVTQLPHAAANLSMAAAPERVRSEDDRRDGTRRRGGRQENRVISPFTLITITNFQCQGTVCMLTFC